MQAAWRLATSSLFARRSRAALLCACVALCAALVCAIACAIASINTGLDQRLQATVGAADLRILHPGRTHFPQAVLSAVTTWPEVKVASGRLIDSQAVKNPRTGSELRMMLYGILPDPENAIRPFEIARGRVLSATGEIVLDARTAQALGADVGDIISVLQFGGDVPLTVVGITSPPPLSKFLGATNPGYVMLPQLQSIAGFADAVHEVEIVLKDPDTAEQIAAARRSALPDQVSLQPTARASAGFQANRASSQIGLIIASIFAFIASSFIIATGMTTGVTERTRELAVLRCIGATKSQLALSQLFAGALVGAVGATVGIPFGVGGSAVLVGMFPDQLPGGFALSIPGLAVAAVGSVGAGMIGSAWSAWVAARASPLQGLAARARPVSANALLATASIALTLISMQAFIVANRPSDSGAFFWLYAPIAIPAMLSGYFLLGVPLTAAVNRLVAGPLSQLLRLPPSLLRRTLAQTPVRHGLTASALMVGLAMLISLWTNGRSVLESWIDRISFPDAFVTGLSIRPDTADRIRSLPGIKDACAITLQNVGSDAFGISGVTRYKTTFFAFEPDPFFAMTKVEWVQGNPATALARLKQGGAVIVAKEFLTARGIGLGETITLRADSGIEHKFEVVGVVTSPGLDIASKFFDIGEGYLDQALNAVFGSREDLMRCFGNDAVTLIQMNFEPGADPESVYSSVRKLPRTGIIAGGTAVWLKNHLHEMIGGTLRIFSLVAVGAMAIASLGVANIIIAGVQARTYQFGVLRAIGAQKWLLARLVIGEALIIAFAASLLGTALGLQAAWGGQAITTASVGITLELRPPLWPTLFAWTALFTVTLSAALPTALALVRKQPRQLLGVTRG